MASPTLSSVADWEAHQQRWKETIAQHEALGFCPPNGQSWDDASTALERVNAEMTARGVDSAWWKNATCINSRCSIPIMDGFALRCAACHGTGVTYCSRACQKADWRRHKKHCTPPQPPRPVTTLCSYCRDEPGTIKVSGVRFCTLECMTQSKETRDPDSGVDEAYSQKWIQEKRAGRIK